MSIVITPESKKLWDKAVAKAKQVKPRVKVVGFCQFDVTGSKGDVYRVEFRKNDQGEFTGSCTCKAHTGPAPKPCFHLAACGSIAKLEIKRRAEARNGANLEAAFCGECGGLRGSQDADEDHRTCTCVEYTGMVVLTSIETPTNTLQIPTSAANISELPLAADWLECSECHRKYPESCMNPGKDGHFCDNCLLFGSAA